jgi:hypothetical protein
MAYTPATDGKAINHWTTADIATTLEVFANKPQVYPELRKSYGQGILTFDLISLYKGSDEFVASESWEVHEELPPFRTMTVGSSISGGASPGVYITFNLASTDLDSEDHYYPRPHQTFWCGTAKDLVACYIDTITIISGTPDTITIKAYPKNILKQLDSYITAGKVLPLAPAVDAGQGTAAVDPTHVGFRKWTFYTEVMKDALGYENAEFAREKYVEPMEGKLYNSEIMRMDMNLDAAMETKIWFGQLNTNTAITQTSLATSASVTVPGTQGLWAWAAERGTSIQFTGATDFTVEHFYQIAEYGETVGLPNSDWIFDEGGDLARRIEKSCKAYITNATGSLNEMFTPDAGGGYKDLTVGFKSILIGGQKIILKPNFLFNNPYLFGISALGIKDAAMIYPLGMVREGKTKEMIPNISLRFRGLGNFKDRKRMIAPFVGMGGPKGMIGAPVVLEGDVTKVHSITEFGLNAMEAWRFIQVYRSDV